MSRMDKSIKTRNRLVSGSLGLEGREEWGVSANEYGIYFWDDENFLKLDCGDGCTTLGIY